MQITVRLFAGLRELAGTGQRELELPEGSSPADVWPALGLGDEPAGLLYAVNRVYAEPDRKLADGDEVALIPPVSGGAFRLTEGPVNLTAVVVAVVDEQAGAIATFLGTVRAQSRGRDVIALEYEAYEEMAEDVIARDRGGGRRALRPLQGRDHAPARTRRGRRDERRHRRLRAAPAGRARRLRGRDRGAEGTRAAVEEGALRGRRGVDRPRLVSTGQALRLSRRKT